MLIFKIYSSIDLNNLYDEYNLILNQNLLVEFLSSINTKQDAYVFSEILVKIINNDENVKIIFKYIYNRMEVLDLPEIETFILILRNIIYQIVYKGNELNQVKLIQKFVQKFLSIVQNLSNYYQLTDFYINFILNLFAKYKKLYDYLKYFNNMFDYFTEWYNNNNIIPLKYPIENIRFYKSKAHNYKENITESEKEEFNNWSIKYTMNQINIIQKIKCKSFDIKNEKEKLNLKYYEKDYDLTDYKFRIGDLMKYKEQKCEIIQSTDEIFKIKLEDKNLNKDKKKLWVMTDDKFIRLDHNKELIDSL